MTHKPREAIPMPDPAPLSPPEDFAGRLATLGVTLDEATLERAVAAVERGRGWT